ncbi:hypothetical protein THIOKS1220008 [Thiocapsa sp. KS1]|nr:hypothetical protein THIOKS1220008 [Thiocapsa sp. KS1]
MLRKQQQFASSNLLRELAHRVKFCNRALVDHDVDPKGRQGCNRLHASEQTGKLLPALFFIGATYPVNANACEVDRALEALDQLWRQAMTMSRECDRELCLSRNPFAYVDEVRVQCGFAAAKPDAEAPLSIQFLQPAEDLVSMQRRLVLRRVAVPAVKVAYIGECNGYLSGGRRPNRLYRAQLV